MIPPILIPSRAELAQEIYEIELCVKDTKREAQEAAHAFMAAVDAYVDGVIGEDEEVDGLQHRGHRNRLRTEQRTKAGL